MTQKQMRKIAREIYECELIHQNDLNSEEKKSQAEDRITELTNRIMSSEDGINTLLEIDAMVQELAQKQSKGETINYG